MPGISPERPFNPHEAGVLPPSVSGDFPSGDARVEKSFVSELRRFDGELGADSTEASVIDTDRINADKARIAQESREHAERRLERLRTSGEQVDSDKILQTKEIIQNITLAENKATKDIQHPRTRREVRTDGVKKAKFDLTPPPPKKNLFKRFLGRFGL